MEIAQLGIIVDASKVPGIGKKKPEGRDGSRSLDDLAALRLALKNALALVEEAIEIA